MAITNSTNSQAVHDHKELNAARCGGLPVTRIIVSTAEINNAGRIDDRAEWRQTRRWPD